MNDITKKQKDWNGNSKAKFFDPDESILSINEGQSIISALPELKREYQNNIAELNNILGLSSLAVDKESGVSQTEAQSNKAYQKANANIYLQARNEKLQHYNDKYITRLKANDATVEQDFEAKKKEQEALLAAEIAREAENQKIIDDAKREEVKKRLQSEYNNNK